MGWPSGWSQPPSRARFHPCGHSPTAVAAGWSRGARRVLNHETHSAAQPQPKERERVEHLFALYEKLTAPLLPATPKAKTRRSQTAATPPRPDPS